MAELISHLITLNPSLLSQSEILNIRPVSKYISEVIDGEYRQNMLYMFAHTINKKIKNCQTFICSNCYNDYFDINKLFPFSFIMESILSSHNLQLKQKVYLGEYSDEGQVYCYFSHNGAHKLVIHDTVEIMDEIINELPFSLINYGEYTKYHFPIIYRYLIRSGFISS